MTNWQLLKSATSSLKFVDKIAFPTSNQNVPFFLIIHVER